MSQTAYYSYPANGVPIYPTAADLPLSAATGATAITADTSNLYEFNGTIWWIIGGPGNVLSVGPFGSTPNADGLSISGDILSLQPASATFPGGVSTGTQSFAGNKTFTGTVDTPQLNLDGSSSGVVSLVPQANAGTYNFNLPITPGSSGQLLTSGGGGSSPMTWSSQSSLVSGSIAVTQVSNSASYYPLFVSSSASNAYPVDVVTGLSFNPATNNLATTTFTGALVGNATTATTSTNIAGGAGGSIPYQSAANTTAMLANGSAGQVLTSEGGTLAPQWSSQSSLISGSVSVTQVTNSASYYPTLISSSATGSYPLDVGTGLSFNPSTNNLSTTTFTGALVGNATSATTATTSTNIAGGAAGSIPYQSAANTTAMLANGSAGQVLTSEGGTSAPQWSSQSSLISGSVSVTQVSNSASYYPVFVSASASGSYPLDVATGISFNPSTNVLSTTNIDLTGVLGLGLTSTSAFINIGGGSNPLIGTNQIGVFANFTSTSAGTGVLSGFTSDIVQAASTTTSDILQFRAMPPTVGSGSAVSAIIDFFSQGASHHLGTVNAAFADNGNFGGNWFINQSGTDPSIFGGAVTFSNTIAATGAITPTGGIVGTTAGGNATAGNVGEYVSSSQTSYTNFPTTGQYGDLGSIPLTAGDWDITLNVVFNLNGSTSTFWETGIGTSPGNNSSGLTTGINFTDSIDPPLATLGGRASISIPNYRVNITSSTTYYAKVFASYSVGQPQYAGRISARRIR